MRVAIVHDYLTQPGGAERVVAAMLERWPDADLRTFVYEPGGTFPVFEGHNPTTSVLQPMASRVSHRALLPVLPFAARSLAVTDVDVVISSSSGWAHGIPVDPDIPHVCYCHNPPRWVYDADGYIESPLLRHGLRPLLVGLRRWDQAAARRPTRYVANSRNVRERIRRNYGRDADVVHPPIDTGRLRPTPLPRDGHLLVLSRLLPYKRVDLALKAAAAVGVPVVVAGDGPDRRRLEEMADPGVDFRGRVEDDEIPALFEGASAFFLGGEEDFGITPLEANAAGRPVVAFGRGGALETVEHGETGVLFDGQVPESAAVALERTLTREWSPESLAAHASQFSEKRFLDRLEAIVDDEVSGARRRRAAAQARRNGFAPEGVAA
jgi:glycosyltransferase involved in cell wall biosynthesis